MKGTSQSPRRKGKSFNPSSSGTLKFDNNKPLDTLTLVNIEDFILALIKINRIH